MYVYIFIQPRSQEHCKDTAVEVIRGLENRTSPRVSLFFLRTTINQNGILIKIIIIIMTT